MGQWKLKELYVPYEIDTDVNTLTHCLNWLKLNIKRIARGQQTIL